ncbi:MAG TPA: hypothetical protein VI386_00340 [Candidatus Sulfotelmatobacter sp.]
MKHTGPRQLICLSLLFSLSALLSWAQTPAFPIVQGSPQELVRATVANEIAPADTALPKHFYLSQKQSSQGVDAKLNVETTEGTAGMLIERNSQPLSGKDLGEEASRLERLCNNPNDLRRKQRREKEVDEHSQQIVKALPDAFLYEFDGTVPGTSTVGKKGDTLVRLRFHPNPRYSPPSHVEQVLLGMQGTLLIDQQEHRLARIDAQLFREVSFGWGVLGHLDKGGTFQVDQADVGNGSWEMTRMRLNLTGKVMMVKSLIIKSEETNSDFRHVPDNLTFAKAVELLKSEQGHYESEQARLQKEEGARTAENRNRR